MKDLHEFLRDDVFPILEAKGGISREAFIAPGLHPDLPGYPDRALLGSIKGTDFYFDKSLPGKMVRGEVDGKLEDFDLEGRI